MPKVFTSQRQKRGELGEDLGVKYLKSKGFDIIERNYTKAFGEIDIIAKKGSVIYFVEVKSRMLDTENYFNKNANLIKNELCGMVDSRKISKIKTTIKVYFAQNGKKMEREEFKFCFLGVIFIKDINTAKIIFDDGLIL